MFGKISFWRNCAADLLIFSVLAARCLSAPMARTDRYSIVQNQSISDGQTSQTLISMSKKFVLGFFSPGASSYRYVGIWHYNVPEKRVVWVANRKNPLLDSLGILKFDNNSNLILLDGRGNSFTVAYAAGVRDVEAAILDTGNFVLRSITNQSMIIWQSFDYPTDTWLPGMNITLGSKLLKSWKSYDDPAEGDYSFGPGVTNASQLIIWWKGNPFWTSGHWNGSMDSLIPELTYIGFVSQDIENTRKGCTRQSPLKCNNDKFIVMPGMQLPNNREKLPVMGDSECQSACVIDCSCTAYANSVLDGCSIWHGNLANLQDGYNGTSVGTLYLRLAASELESISSSGHKILWIAGVLSSVVFLIFCLILFIWIKRSKNKGKGQQHDHPSMISDTTKLWEGEETGSHFMMFSFSQVRNATDNFSTENKLGEGGFGPVYKGSLPHGLEIAVKRLAANSGQGLPEFRNEILLIAKLQHRNLVGLLGCCIQGEEMLLVYEYMPNKSLDFFLFEQSRRSLLDWEMRINIIEGVAQGLIYLHKHSRLTIIHRDLKASNILLDISMNPKISDFGMARIFDPEGTQANTKRVVGTYGYMAPEYAMAGIFSSKSDVFSYGVLLMEIISGIRNSGPQRRGNSLFLLGYAWELWKGGRCCDLIDKSLHCAYPENMVLRCIHVSLLCVQENATDRPSMTEVISMITNENTTLPDPKQPGFLSMLLSNDTGVPEETYSLNGLSVTNMDGR